MFTITGTPIKFVGLAILFVWCTLWCLYELTRLQSRTSRISAILHLAMAVVMLAMVPQSVWQPIVMVVPIPVITGFFGLATAWFVVLAVREFGPNRTVGLHLAGHAAMFGAMTWHLAAMAMMSMRRAAMGGTHNPEMMAAARQPGGPLWIVALIGIPFMAYLLVASGLAVRDLFRTSGAGAPSCHEPRPVGSSPYRLAALADVAMNFGMFWMSTGLMVPVAPLFAALSF